VVCAWLRARWNQRVSGQPCVFTCVPWVYVTSRVGAKLRWWSCVVVQVGNQATVLGFVGLPYTLATYLVEGASSKVRTTHSHHAAGVLVTPCQPTCL
jgi:hypothetical protein